VTNKWEQDIIYDLYVTPAAAPQDALLVSTFDDTLFIRQAVSPMV